MPNVHTYKGREIIIANIPLEKRAVLLEKRAVSQEWARAGSQREGLAANVKWASMKDMLEKFHMSTVYL